VQQALAMALDYNMLGKPAKEVAVETILQAQLAFKNAVSGNLGAKYKQILFVPSPNATASNFSLKISVCGPQNLRGLVGTL